MFSFYPNKQVTTGEGGRKQRIAIIYSSRLGTVPERRPTMRSAPVAHRQEDRLDGRNILYYGDNLDILRNHIPDASVDLIYLDPPFNSKRDYNVLFKEKSGEASPAQIEAFTDTWEWDRAAEATYAELVQCGPEHVGKMIGALRGFLGANDMMAYLVMMAARLVELHRVLKATGSLYLHCDPTASHYLKVVLDTVFGLKQFRNEIAWQRSSAHSDAKQGANRFGRVHDIILFYARSELTAFNVTWNPYDPAYVASHYGQVEANSGRRYQTGDLTANKGGGDTSYEWKGVRPPSGRFWAYSKAIMQRFDEEGRLVYSASGMPRYKRYLDEMLGRPHQDVWDDIPPVNSQAQERLGYPTQKPLALLERIIAASSNPGDVVLDPFCGCGTAVVAAQKLGRRWIGIDVTHLSITLMKKRLEDSFPGIAFAIHGEPADAGSARMFAEADRYQFQWWALSLVNAMPVGGSEKKGADKGIDGVITFLDDATGKPKRCLVQVKSGHVNRGTVEQLVGTITREKAEMGLLVTLEPSTGPMRTEAVEAGFYHSPGWDRDYPRVQILTVEELMSGVQPKIPYGQNTFAKAGRVRKAGDQQQGLDLG